MSSKSQKFKSSGQHPSLPVITILLLITKAFAMKYNINEYRKGFFPHYYFYFNCLHIRNSKIKIIQIN